MDVGILTAEEGLASVFAFTALKVSFSLISIAAGAALVCSPPATSFVATSILFLTGARADFEALVARFAAALTFGDATDRLPERTGERDQQCCNGSGRRNTCYRQFW